MLIAVTVTEELGNDIRGKDSKIGGTYRGTEHRRLRFVAHLRRQTRRGPGESRGAEGNE